MHLILVVMHYHFHFHASGILSQSLVIIKIYHNYCIRSLSPILRLYTRFQHFQVSSNLFNRIPEV